MLIVFFGFEGLSWSVDEKTLKDAFASYGDVTEGEIQIPLLKLFVKLASFSNCSMKCLTDQRLLHRYTFTDVTNQRYDSFDIHYLLN